MIKGERRNQEINQYFLRIHLLFQDVSCIINCWISLFIEFWFWNNWCRGSWNWNLTNRFTWRHSGSCCCRDFLFVFRRFFIFLFFSLIFCDCFSNFFFIFISFINSLIFSNYTFRSCIVLSFSFLFLKVIIIITINHIFLSVSDVLCVLRIFILSFFIIWWCIFFVRMLISIIYILITFWICFIFFYFVSTWVHADEFLFNNKIKILFNS